MDRIVDGAVKLEAKLAKLQRTISEFDAVIRELPDTAERRAFLKDWGRIVGELTELALSADEALNGKLSTASDMAADLSARLKKLVRSFADAAIAADELSASNDE